MSDLQKLYETRHSQNADDASVDRLVALQPYRAREGALTPGLILYVLDPMYAMGVDAFDQILAYTDDHRLKVRLSSEDIERTKEFFRGKRQEIDVAFLFLEWRLDFSPAEMAPDAIQATIKEKLMEFFTNLDPDVAQDITSEYYRMYASFWRR